MVLFRLSDVHYCAQCRSDSVFLLGKFVIQLLLLMISSTSDVDFSVGCFVYQYQQDYLNSYG